MKLLVISLTLCQAYMAPLRPGSRVSSNWQPHFMVTGSQRGTMPYKLGRIGSLLNPKFMHSLANATLDAIEVQHAAGHAEG